MSTPKTAAQHNAPQTGEHNFAPNPPPDPTPSPSPAPRPTPLPKRSPIRTATPVTTQEKSWNLRDIKDTRQNVIEAVQRAAFVPPACKAMIVEAIEQNHASARLIRLDAHCQVADTKSGRKHMLTMDISEL